MCPQCPHDVPTIAPLVLMQQHLCLPGQAPPHCGDGGQVLVTPPARAGRPDTAMCSVPLPGPRELPLGRASPSQAGTQGAIWESSKTRTQVLHSLCPTPEEVDWDGELWLLFPATRHMVFTLFTKKNQVPKRPRLRDQVSLLNLSR